MDVNTTSDPSPKERKGADSEEMDQEDVITERDPKPGLNPNPLKPVPSTPDANPIDPRVGQPW